jgi:predicted PurR-regulated permease PerM
MKGNDFMKFEWNKKYAQITFWVCLAILFTVISVFFFWNYNDFGAYFAKFISVMNPIVYGIVIAYILNKILKIYETKIFAFMDKRPGKMRLKRTLSLFCTYITFILIIVSFGMLLGTQIVDGITDFYMKFPSYVKDAEDWLLSLAEENDTVRDIVFDIFDYVNGLVDKLSDIVTELMPQITIWISGIITFLKDIAIGLILSVYFLAQKEKFVAQGKRFVRAVFSEGKYNGVVSLMKQIDNSFGGYLVAMGVDSIFVMFECMLVFGLCGIPYYPLISFIIGVTNFIPFFGPFIGAIPSAFIIFMANPTDPTNVFLFIFLIIVIQQIDGNIIAPRIIGNHLDLSPVWVVIAVTVMSGFFGFIGMIIGVPLFSVIYTLIDNTLAKKLEKKNCNTDVIDFYSDGNMGKTMEMELMDIEAYRAKKAPWRTRLFSKFKKKNSDIVHDYYDDDIFEETFETDVYKDEEDFLAHTSEHKIDAEMLEAADDVLSEASNETAE